MDDWEEKDVGDPDASDGFFVRNLLKLLHQCARLAGATSGYCAVTGIEIGEFVMVGDYGAPGTDRIRHDMAGAVRGINKSDIIPRLALEADAVFLPLVGAGELYGFIRLWGRVKLEPHERQELDRIAGGFSAANFARRVQVLSLPSLEFAGDDLNLDLSSIEKRLIDITALSFGADGAILRRYVPETDNLISVEVAGDVPSDLVADRAPGEMVSGRLLSDRSHN